MTREEIEKEYEIEHGMIKSPGKFEGESVYVPCFWDAYLNGFHSDEDEDGWLIFDLDETDWQEWPELKGVRQLRLLEDEQGFVYSDIKDRA